MALVYLFFVFFSPFLAGAEISARVGVNYGQLGDNLPSPSSSVLLIKDVLKASRVKIYDVNPEILTALANTSLPVSVMVPNALVPNISRSQAFSNLWVKENILPFRNTVLFRYLLVGNEILTNPDTDTWFKLAKAMRRVKKSLNKFKLDKIKVGTPSALEVLETTFPPSNGTFRKDIAESIVKPMLSFLHETRSYFFLDVYPFFTWAKNSKDINLNYALLQKSNMTYKDPGSGLTYTNLLDQLLDSVYFAMEKLGYPEVPIFIAETGWPNAGDVDQIGANICNAATYNRNVVKKVTAKARVGTPARPGTAIPTFIFSLCNENQKPGPGTERHFGMLYPNGSSIYQIDLTGEIEPEEYTDVLPEATNNEPYEGDIWCVVAKGVTDEKAVSDALSYACSQGNGTCEAIQPGKECYKPSSLVSHANYAFSKYWSQTRSVGGNCYFSGVAEQTTTNPSFGKCTVPSVRQ